MDPDQWRQISHFYHKASERPADERRAFLKAVCGSDDALRREVESLLADDTRAEAFLAAPAAERHSPTRSLLIRKPCLGSLILA